MTDPVRELTDELRETFDTDEATATEAAEKATAFAEDYEFDLVPADLVREIEASHYDDFTTAFNWWVGDVAADIDDCTNSRDYRFLGFDTVEAIQ